MSGRTPTRPLDAPCRFDHEHSHGSSRCYQGGCGCVPCRVGNTNRVADYRSRAGGVEVNRRRRAGVALANHVNSLRAEGMSVQVIADLAGVAYNVVENVSRNPQAVIRDVSRDALKGVTVEMWKPHLMPAKQIPNVGVRRRMQALMFMGYHGAELMGRLGKDRKYVTRMVNSEWVFQATHDAVRALYDELWDKPAPESYGGRRAAVRARREGWVGPLGWDDESIDDPAAEPSTGEPVSTGEALLEDVSFLLESGESPEGVAVILNRKLGSIGRLAERHGRRDIARRFYGRAA